MEVSAPHVKDRSRSYPLYILVLLLLLNTLSAADRHLFSILIPAIKSEFRASDGLLGLIGGPGFIVSYVLCSMPLARLADRWSRRGVVALSAMLWSGATAACGLTANIGQLAAARMVVGVGEAGGLPPSQAMLASLFGERRRSAVMGALASGTHFGLVVGLLGGAAIASLWGWRAAFFCLAIPGFPLALLLWFTGPGPKDTAVIGSRAPSLGVWAALRQCWAIRSLRLLAIGVGTFNIFGYAGAVWMPTFFMRSHGMSAVQAAAWLGLGAAVGGIAGSLASGMAADRLLRFGPQWQLRLPAIAFLLAFPINIAVFTLPGGTGFSLAGLHVPGVACLSVLNAFLLASWAGPAFAAAARLVQPSMRAQATAMIVVVINVIGSTVGPSLGGLVSDLLAGLAGAESLRLGLLAMSSLTVAGGLVLWRAAAHYPSDLADAKTTAWL
ncbi:MFS transporter [Novosphingobium sp. P6W]|uniref:MFS transporter n=1 Tax=Novosphingobium sp. P6W TaxID=1609758 RepID=UPI0005C4E62A|nr:MFS transporter [Novosphingobium sp. P6W]AXB80317.1 MFS transporter [Novosphingobium sp. P6W]